jgi:hypothetical protein
MRAFRDVLMVLFLVYGAGNRGDRKKWMEEWWMSSYGQIMFSSVHGKLGWNSDTAKKYVIQGGTCRIVD